MWRYMLSPYRILTDAVSFNYEFGRRNFSFMSVKPNCYGIESGELDSVDAIEMSARFKY